ncbi:MAG: hypothetical protein Kow00128_19950 [Deltaproteobacteria bacterium]
MAIARILGESLQAGDVVSLSGDLGAGKTLFCKGIGEALGIDPVRIVSPSFVLVTEHREGRIPFFHLDAYRLGSVREAEEAGLQEWLEGQGICAVEWAERIESLLPNDRIRVTFHISDERNRKRAIRVETPDVDRFERFRGRVEPFAAGG